MIVVGVLLMIVGLRIKILESNAHEQDPKVVTQERVVGRININTATLRQLVDLPSIGDKMAQRIVDYRISVGSFDTKDQLKNVSGIGDKTYENIKDKIDI